MGIVVIRVPLTQLSCATPVALPVTQYNPYDHPVLLVVTCPPGPKPVYHVLGTVPWATLRKQRWTCAVGQLAHYYPELSPTTPALNAQRASVAPQTLVMLGSEHQQALAMAACPSFDLEDALLDLQQLVYNKGGLAWAPRVPWVALWVVIDAVGDDDLTTVSTAKERTAFFAQFDEYTETDVAKLLHYNRVKQGADGYDVVSPSNADLRWFHEHCGGQVRPQFMFRVPMHLVDHGEHAPVQPDDGTRVRISYQQVAAWLWERQCSVRRAWRTRAYAHNAYTQLPHQLQYLVRETQRMLLRVQRSKATQYTCDSGAHTARVLDIEDFVQKAPPCMQRALLQDKWVPDDPQNQLPPIAAEERQWLQNDARNQVIRAAAEAGYPEDFLQQVMLYQRHHTEPGDTLQDLKRLVGVGYQMRYPGMSCHQLRAANVPGLPCVWNTPRPDLAQAECHAHYIVTRGSSKSAEQHKRDATRFKKPSFYWLTADQ